MKQDFRYILLLLSIFCAIMGVGIVLLVRYIEAI